MSTINMKYPFLIISCIVLFSLNAQTNFQVTFAANNVSCHGYNDGSIELSMHQGIAPYIIKLYNRTPSTKQKVLQKNQTQDTSFTIENLSSQHYYVVIEDSKSNRYQIETTIEEPEKLSILDFTIEKEVSSEHASDGVLKANASGGTPPYSFEWSTNANNQKTQFAQNIGYGTYQCTISDANHCGPLAPTFYYYPGINQKNDE